jgi:hypothetical protein
MPCPRDAAKKCHRHDKDISHLQFLLLSSSLAPCRLVRQEYEFEQQQGCVPLLLPAPCRLVRQERQFERLQWERGAVSHRGVRYGPERRCNLLCSKALREVPCLCTRMRYGAMTAAHSPKRQSPANHCATTVSRPFVSS